jgi:hypothetical protein
VAVETAAKRTIDRFQQAARAAGIGGEGQMVGSSIAGGADIFARIARRFDVAVVGQADPDKPEPEQLIIEAALFQSGRPLSSFPISRSAPSRSIGSWSVRTGAVARRGLSVMLCRFSAAPRRSILWS